MYNAYWFCSVRPNRSVREFNASQKIRIYNGNGSVERPSGMVRGRFAENRRAAGGRDDAFWGFKIQ